MLHIKYVCVRACVHVCVRVCNLMLSFAVGYQLTCFETQCRYLFLVCGALIQPTSMPDFDDLIQQQ